jgi:L-lactate dehydrogenase complex protein LldG
MNLETRSAFLRNVRRALGHPPDRQRTTPRELFPESPSEESRLHMAHIDRRNAAERRQLLETLRAAAEPLNMKVLAADSVEAAGDLIVQIAATANPEWGEAKQVCSWRHPLIDQFDLGPALASLGIPLVTPETEDAGQPAAGLDGPQSAFVEAVWQSFIGITSADWCVADSATLVLRTNPGQPRSVSLVPSIHVAVTADERILADLGELYALLRWRGKGETVDLTNCLTFISGPSKTADIEATLVHGAHGPRELYLIVLAG